MQLATVVLFVTTPIAASAVLGLALTAAAQHGDQPEPDTETAAHDSGLIPGGDQ